VVDIKSLIGIIALSSLYKRSPAFPQNVRRTENERKMSANKNKNLSRDDRGMEFPEYALAVALIALVIIMAFTDLGTSIADKISQWKNAVFSN
jgi:Flp pilus assembly pilin Flp